MSFRQSVRSTRQPVGTTLDTTHPLMKGVGEVWTPDRAVGYVHGGKFTQLNNGVKITAGSKGIGFTTSGQLIGGIQNNAFSTSGYMFPSTAPGQTLFMLFESFDQPSTATDGPLIYDQDTGFIYHSAGGISTGTTAYFVAMPGVTGVKSVAFSSSGYLSPVLWVGTNTISTISSYSDGVLNNTLALTGATGFYAPISPFDIQSSAGWGAWNGRIYLAGVVERAWSAAEVAEFSRNPWQIFNPPPRRYTGIAGTVSTTSRPSADVSVVGWSFTGSSLSASINEVTRNDASYIEAAYGVTGSIVTLDIPRSPGNHTISFTSEYLVGFASSGQFKFSLLDDTNAVLGTTGWQAVTSIIVQYDLPVTISSTATRLKIEIQA